jgi:hypothetical protein
VITISPLASPARTKLPWSTRRRPTRPATGAVIFVYESCSFALSIWLRSTRTAPSYWRTSETWVSTCCLAIESCLKSVR